MKMNKALCFAVLVVMAFSIAVTASAGQKIDVILAGSSGPTDISSIAHEQLAKRLNDTGFWNATVKINASMGECDDITEQAMSGVPVLNATDPGRIASFVPEFGVIQMPYIIPDQTYLDKIMDSELYKKWDKEFQEKGLKLIANNLFYGARSWITKSKVIRKPEDLKGMKIRTIGSPIFTKSVTAMGAIATALPWAETYQAMEQGMVDGTEAQITGLYSMRFYEPAKVISLSEHFMLIGTIVAGTAWFDTLPPERQEELLRLARDVYHDSQDLAVELSQKYIDDMVKNHGVTVVEIDKQPFIDAVQPVYKELGYEGLRKELHKELGLTK